MIYLILLSPIMFVSLIESRLFSFLEILNVAKYCKDGQHHFKGAKTYLPHKRIESKGTPREGERERKSCRKEKEMLF